MMRTHIVSILFLNLFQIFYVVSKKSPSNNDLESTEYTVFTNLDSPHDDISKFFPETNIEPNLNSISSSEENTYNSNQKQSSTNCTISSTEPQTEVDSIINDVNSTIMS